MILFDDEDYDDYYVADDESNERRSEGDHNNDRTPTAGERIVFAPEASEYGVETAEKRRSGWSKGCGCVAVILILIAGAIGYFRYLSPTVDDAVMDVSVVRVEKRGLVFKTYEAEVVDPKRTADQTTPYSHPTSVTIDNESLARELQSQQADGQTVRLRYRTYSATLPWRGESKTVVYAIE